MIRHENIGVDMQTTPAGEPMAMPPLSKMLGVGREMLPAGTETENTG